MNNIKLIASFALFTSAGFSEIEAKLTVQGISATSVTLSAHDLAQLPTHSVKVIEQGRPASFRGVFLSDVLALVRTPTGEAFNGSVASYYLLVGGGNEYQAVFSWAEVDPTFSDRKIYVVMERDGHALSDKEGPFELVVPDERRTARWVRQLTSLKVEPEPTTTAYGSAETRWIAANLPEMESVKVGMTRRDLLKVFTTEGGISTPTWRQYVYKKCGYIKVAVEFDSADKPAGLERLEDRITKISKPFLQFAIMD